MKKIIGYYNELEYSVFEDEEQIYRAGNSWVDSQAYVTASEGVGLKTMKQFCEQTSKDLAKERGSEFVGVQYDEN